ncbi:MAG: aminoacetone oxidase family FAD-binding enzyme [Clostridia bacterium]|nr:aminoacetone oxidase family FAD-binding enzyme [Clostridia bacterium]
MGKVIIIGGGAAGLACAVTASRLGDDVTVLERMDRVGKKILATGNGRCNLMNLHAPVYPGGEAFARQVLQAMPTEKQIRFWHSLGLFLREEADGRVYPVTGQASTVLDALRFGFRGETVTGQEVIRLLPGKKWQVQTGDRVFSADRVVVTGGGCAQPALGSNGSCVRLLKSLGYGATALLPALTQLTADKDVIRGLEGIRIRCLVRVMEGEREIHRERGEVLFTAYGLSGVCIMHCARYADVLGRSISLHLYDALSMSEENMLGYLKGRQAQLGEAPAERLLTGFLVPRLAQAVVRYAIPECKSVADVKDKELVRLVRALGDFRIGIRGIKGFDSAQVTRGGVDPTPFDPSTMASALHHGLHAAGEVLDVDGDCGGYNLMFAFASGILAGKNGRKASWEEE